MRRLIVDLRDDDFLPAALFQRLAERGLQERDAGLAVMGMERQHEAVRRVARVGGDDHDAVLHAGGEQSRCQRRVRRVEDHIGDVFERQPRLAVVLRDDDLPVGRVEFRRPT